MDNRRYIVLTGHDKYEMMEQMADDCQWHFLSHQKGIFFIALNLIDNFTFAIDFQNVFSCGVDVADGVVGAVGVGREGVVALALGVLRGEAVVGEPTRLEVMPEHDALNRHALIYNHFLIHICSMLYRNPPR